MRIALSLLFGDIINFLLLLLPTFGIVDVDLGDGSLLTTFHQVSGSCGDAWTWPARDCPLQISVLSAFSFEF